ncbi:DNA-binding MarR family transcriptional regulator [Umezawaea tangerina]|uniref:DNA-binding MarR family transcriptional regulator n=1 Tax=Umezawaea tangerina TaxID=84725 RepID=A0A2T0STK4_9PSEU|nr:DNA-binding MarR family transcriptional regulator [Umezawaea tangerina]
MRGTKPVTDLRKVFDDLVRFETVLWNTVDARLRRDHDFTLGGLNVLMVVDATAGCRVHDIARALAITVGGTSQAVDRLEKADLLARRPNPEDRRSSIVELTPTGRTILDAARATFDDELERHLRAPLSADTLAQLAGALDTVRRATTTPSEPFGTAP